MKEQVRDAFPDMDVQFITVGREGKGSSFTREVVVRKKTHLDFYVCKNIWQSDDNVEDFIDLLREELTADA